MNHILVQHMKRVIGILMLVVSGFSVTWGLNYCALDADGDGWGGDVENILTYEYFSLTGDGGNDRGVAVGDLNGDGLLDVYTADTEEENTIWINEGDRSFNSGASILGDTGNSQEILLGDFDDDGDLDAYVANYGEQSKLRINDGDANFSAYHISGDISDVIDADIGDVDGDGDLDIVKANYDQPNTLWLNNGDGEFTDASNNLTGDAAYSYGVTLGDVDGDGDLDIYVANNHYMQLDYLLINNGSGEFTQNNISGSTGASNKGIFGDFDDDGDIDIYVVRSSWEGNRLWINDGNENFILQNISGDEENSVWATVGDPDDDGDLDIHVANGNGDQNFFWLNDGEGNFASGHIAGDGGYTSESVMADFDGDGDLDMYITNWMQNYFLISTESGDCSDLGMGWYEVNSLNGTGDSDDNNPSIYPGATIPSSNGISSSIKNNTTKSDEDKTDEEDDKDHPNNDEDQEEEDDDASSKDDDGLEENTVCSDDLVGWLYANGLTKYDNETDFRGEDYLLRGEATKFISHYAQLLDLSDTYGFCEFTDIFDFDSTLEPYILQACSYGLMKGSDGKFMPREKMTYAQGITIAMRALSGFQDETIFPWYQQYIDLAQAVGISIDVPISMMDSTTLLRKEFGYLLCQSAQVANTHINQ